MSRENFRSRLGFILVKRRLRHRHRQCVEIPLRHRCQRRRRIHVVHHHLPGHHGVPILTMGWQWAVPATRSAPCWATRPWSPRAAAGIHGWLCVIGCCLLMMYYTTVSGWMLGYCFQFASGTFSGMQPSDVDTVWTDMLAQSGEMTLYMVIIVLAGFIVCSFGLQKGWSGSAKWMMICLLALLIVILAINSLTLDGAMEA